MRSLLLSLGLILCGAAVADEPAEAPAGDSDTPAAAAQSANMPKVMSGMSILGNEEAPKSLVIIPWKASEIGDDITLTDTLDDRAKPVDKDVFLRELSFYEIRSGE